MYCIFAQPTNSSVLVKLPSRDITQWLNENIAFGCSRKNTIMQDTRDDEPTISCINQVKNIDNEVYNVASSSIY